MSSDESELDPRIQIELEKLNVATENINKYEIELEEAKNDFRKLLVESVDRIKHLSGKLENSIQMARPYYEARLNSTEMTKNTHRALASFDKARSFNTAAKEMVFLAEQGLGKKSVLDAACQEMLSHATSRVNETQHQCIEMEHSLKICELKQEFATNKVMTLQTQLKSAIKTSSLKIRRHLLFINLIAYQHGLLFLPYYETRANSFGNLSEQKKRIVQLEAKVSEAKLNYNETLRCLELISEEIHKMRNEKFLLQNNQNIFGNDTSNRIDYTDEYLDFPQNLSPDSDTNSETFRSQGYSHINDNNEKWTEIILSDPYSGTSGYSYSPSSTENRTVLKSDDEDLKSPVLNENDKKVPESLTNWITKTNLKNKDRRQSLDILYDASDRVKDALTQGIQKVGRTLERRNSESEASLEFFLFNRSDNLTDEQIENLHLNQDITSIYGEYLTPTK